MAETVFLNINWNTTNHAASSMKWDDVNKLVILQTGADMNFADPTDNTKTAKFDLSNIATATQRTVNIPNANSTTVQANTGSAHNFVTAISAQGVVSEAQPAFTDISGSVAATQLPNPTATTLGGIESYAAVSHQWINAISTSGVPSSTQPASSDLSDVVGWTSYTPSVSASSGTITTASATGRYFKIGKLVMVTIAVTVTTNGTGNGVLLATLPFTAGSTASFKLVGRESAVSGEALIGLIAPSATNVQILALNAATVSIYTVYPAANGYVMEVSGSYESST